MALTYWLDDHHKAWKREMAESAQEPGGQSECPCAKCIRSRLALDLAGYVWEGK